MTGGHDDPRRLSALGLVMGAERRIDAVRVEQEKQFYLATTAALEGSRRSQLGLSALVGLVLALGVAGVTVVTSRSRSRIATAYDALHRVLLLDRLRGALAAGTTVAVILIDLDGFKNVNDTLGHPAGDELLRSAAQRLLGCVRPEDTTARLGGDEFAVLTDGGPQIAQTVGRRIVEALRRPFGVVGHEVRIGVELLHAASMVIGPGGL